MKQSLEDPDDDGVKDIHEQFLRQEEHSTKAQTERISHDVRMLMQCVPHPVVVLTAAATMSKTQKPIPLGIAVSSFNTVTLDPPTISFNVKEPSQTLDAIRTDHGRFRIHFFAASPGGAQLVASFTKGNNPTAYNDRLKLAKMDFSGKSLNGEDHFSTAAHIQSKSVSAIMECELTQQLAVGDHIIAVATVSNVWTREKKTKPYLSYVQHNYVQTPYNILKTEVPMDTKRSQLASSINSANHIQWGLPLFPTETDRIRFRDKLVNYVRYMPDLSELSVVDVKRRIQENLKISHDPLGVSVTDAILYAMQRRDGKSEPDPSKAEFFALSEFYNPLSQTDITTITNRAKEFVRNDPLFLDLGFEALFGFLGVSYRTSNLLASDIMDALRNEELARPFSPSVGCLHHTDTPVTTTLEHLEQVEYRLRQHMKSQDPFDMSSISSEKLAWAVSDHKWVRIWVKQIRARIHVETFPELYSPDKYDFEGHLTLPETRVAIMRIISFLDRATTLVHPDIHIQWYRILLSCRIHPLVSGFNFMHFIEKLRYWNKTVSRDEYKRLVASMVDSNFNSRIGVTDLNERANDLANAGVESAIKIVADQKSDSLHAALALQPKCSVTMPDGLCQDLDSPSLRHILRNVIENNYGQYSVNEKVMVDAFLEHSWDE